MKKHGNLLTILILLGLVAGAIVGQILHSGPAGPIGDDHWTKHAGDIVLIRPLMVLIIPLVFVSVVTGVASVGDPSKLGVIGGSTLLYYLVTMLLAVTLGSLLVTTFQPGDLSAADGALLREAAATDYQAQSATVRNIEEAAAQRQDQLGGAWLNILRQMIPRNIIDEMAQGRTLGVIVFSLLLGLAIAAGGEKARPVANLFDSLFSIIMRLVGWIIWITPIGVFFLVAWTVGKIGLGVLSGPLGKYIVLVIFGLAVHGLIVLPSVLFLFTRRNPFKFMWQMRRALMTAFGTDSSSATLPVTIESAEEEGGCSKRAANFVLPLGSTINMDGTALYEAVAVVFLFQLWGIDLDFGQLLVVVITATLAAVGAAGIPSAGVVMMVIVINAVNQSLAGETQELPLEAIGVIIGVDRIVDMCRTTVNVWGDAVGAKIITKIAPDTEEEMERALG